MHLALRSTSSSLFFFVALLAACGGGGSDGGSSGSVTIPTGVRTGTASAGADVSAGNYAALSGQAIQTLLNTVGDGGTLSSTLEADRAHAAALSARRSRFDIAALARRALAFSGQRFAAATRKQALATQSETFQCGVSGTLTATVNDADGNNEPSSGDTVTFAFANCVDVSGDPALNGQFALSFVALVLDAQKDPTAIEAAVTATALSVQGLGSLNGSAHLWATGLTSSTEHSRVSYQNMTSSVGGVVATLNFDVDETATATTATDRINGAVLIGGQTYVLVQSVAFDSAAAEPTTGRLRIVDVQGDRVDVVARGTLVDREFYVSTNAGTTPDASIIGTPWSTFHP